MLSHIAVQWNRYSCVTSIICKSKNKIVRTTTNFQLLSITLNSIYNIYYQKCIIRKNRVYEKLINFVGDLFLCSVWWNDRVGLITDVIFIPFIIIRRLYHRRHFHWGFSSDKQFVFFFFLLWVDRFRLIKYWFGIKN